MKTKKIPISLIIYLIAEKTIASSWCTTIFCWNEDWLKVVKDNLPDNIIGSDKLIEVIMWYTSFFLPYAWIFAFVALIYAWFLYITSAANEENAEKAKKIVGFVALWIVLITLSYSLVSLFINIT